METTIETKRLNAIRLKFVLFEKKCSCCGNFFRREKVWHVLRSGVNRTIHDWYYCQNCMSTQKDVLHEIDTDECPFGIAFIDDNRKFKTDTTRMKNNSPFPPPPSIKKAK